MTIFYSARFAEHTPPPGHPERPERAEVFAAVAAAAERRGVAIRDPRPATREELARIHTARHLDAIDATAGRAVMLDADTFTSPETRDVAYLAAGAAIDAAGAAQATGRASVALVRPPGHHAEPDRAMGFCLLNNVAVAAAAWRASGAGRVAIVDIDVHHGNGTQAAFYDDPRVLYVSTHQFPYYPGTGAARETGIGPGEGYTVNVPLAAGAGDAEYLAAFQERVLPALARFRPDGLLVSAGFDAHVRDPLGAMRVTTPGYRAILDLLADAGARLCGGRTVWVTEGGYDLVALRDCLEALIDVVT